MPKIVGGCLCRAIRYESDAQPAMVAVCHCTSCQKNTATSRPMRASVPGGAYPIPRSKSTSPAGSSASMSLVMTIGTSTGERIRPDWLSGALPYRA